MRTWAKQRRATSRMTPPPLMLNCEFDAHIKAKFTAVLVKGTPDLYKSHNTVLAATRAVLANDATYGPGQEFVLGEGRSRRGFGQLHGSTRTMRCLTGIRSGCGRCNST